MNASSLLCFTAILVLAGMPLRADNDIILGPWLTKKPASQPVPTDSLGKYKQYVHFVVGSYWYPAINQHFGRVPYGMVHIRFTIHSDGSITDVTVLEGKDQEVLAKISMDALENPAPFKPFSDALIKQVGEKYTDDFTFSTEDKK